MSTAYCATCRNHFTIDSNPPHGVIHANAGRTLRHLHPITRDVLTEAKP